MTTIDLKVTGVRGGRPTYSPNKGRIVTHIKDDNSSETTYIAVDAFEGYLQTYERREKADIEIQKGNFQWSGTMDELISQLQK